MSVQLLKPNLNAGRFMGGFGGFREPSTLNPKPVLERRASKVHGFDRPSLSPLGTPRTLPQTHRLRVLGFRVSGFRVQGSGFRVQGSGFRV